MNIDISNPFIQVAKQKLRFSTNSGHLSVEDLFDLQLKDLDRIGGDIAEQLGGGRQSLLSNPDRKVTQAEKENELRLEIVKAVIHVKETENAEKRNAASKAKQREFLKGLKEKKRMEELEGLSLEEIDAQLADLDDDAEMAEEPATASAEA